MKILFLGLLYNLEEETKLITRSKCGLQGAANTFQWNLINGLDELLDQPVQIMNSLPIGSFPHAYQKLFIPSRNWSHQNGSRDKEIGFINLPIIKQLIRRFAFYREVKRWCSVNSENNPVIMAYSLYLPYLKVLSVIKRRYKNLCTCIIVPDLPNAFGFQPSESYLKKRVWQYIGNQKYAYAKSADAFILLTKAMAQPLGVLEKPYVVVEGISTDHPSLVPSANPDLAAASPLRVILYSGVLHQRYGIDKLITAFSAITQENYELWLCGEGDYQEEIIKAAKKDQRIKYYGYLSKASVQKLQQQATLFINPRTNEEEYTKYSFPSKTIEYMENAKPVLMYKLEGIPEEYDDYLYYIGDNSAEGIKEAIVKILEKNPQELEERGRAAYEFVSRYKNGKTQASKILNMLKNLQPKNPNAKKILQINITCQYGSTGKIVEELHHCLLQNGYQSNIAYSAFNSNLEGSFPIESKFENYLRRALNKYLGRKYSHSTLGTLRLIRNIKRLHPDLIHLHNIQQNSVNFPLLMKFLAKYRVPVIYTLHDCWAFTGGCYHFTSLGCDGYQYGCRECKLDQKQRDICNKPSKRIWEEKNTALHSIKVVRIICVSKWLKTCAEQSFMKDLPLQVIYNGIDTDLFRPVYRAKREELGISDQEFVILGAANNWDNKKGLNVFTDLARKLSSPFRIILIGIDQENCPSGILAVKRTDDRQELAMLYSCADVFFNASKEETFGLTAAEAMACGTPVIAYHSTACPEIISPDTGILLNTDRMEELIAAIKIIQNNGRSFYSKNCSQHIKNNFSLELMSNQYLNLYTQLLENKEGH